MTLPAWTRIGLALALTTIGVEGVQPQRAPAIPIVVELFTSEGCSDCPPADAVLANMIATPPVEGALVVGLGEHVDYWDRQGWKDRFSSAALTARQQMYGAHFRLDSVYTPQMIVDGRVQFVGSDGRTAGKAIAQALATPHAVVQVAVDARNRNTIRASVNVAELPVLGRGDRADVVVAVTEDRLRSGVTAGENRGRTLTHAAVVRSMTTIGEAGSAPLHADVAIAAEWKAEALKIVAFVQERRGRAILGAAATPLPR